MGEINRLEIILNQTCERLIYPFPGQISSVTISFFKTPLQKKSSISGAFMHLATNPSIER